MWVRLAFVLGDSRRESRGILSRRCVRSAFGFPADTCSEVYFPIARLVTSIRSVDAVRGLILFFSTPSLCTLSLPCPLDKEPDKQPFFFLAGGECNSSWDCEL